MEKLVISSIIFSLVFGLFACEQSTDNLQFPSVENADPNSVPETVYVEVLCFIDSATYELHGSNARAVYDYFLSFWKTVDKYFKLLNNPNVRITLSQILAPQNHDFPSSSEIDASKTLINFGKYIYLEKNLPHHDVAVFFTSSQLISLKKNGTSQSIAGLTFQGKACDIDDGRKLVKSVAIVRDNGKSYTGIRKTIALIGQLLGAVEEGPTDGFIMSSNNNFRDSSFKFKWSDCSMNSIRYFLNNGNSFENLTCLFNKPTTNMDLNRHWLPGQALSLNHHCEILTGNFGTCWTKGVSSCTNMLCRDKYGQCSPEFWGPALEGSWCHHSDSGIEMRCSYGQCVPFNPLRNETSFS